MLNAELLIFDLDGTLIDSKADISRALNETLVHFGSSPLNPELINRHVGTGIGPLIEANVPAHHLHRAHAQFSDRYLSGLVEKTQVMDGMMEVLSHYADKIKVVLTSKREKFTTTLLERLGLQPHFKAAYSRESFAEIKPSPVPIVELCAIWGIPTARALMIGDTIADVQAGKAAGAQTCAYLSGYGIERDLLALKPDLAVRNAIELIGVIA